MTGAQESLPHISRDNDLSANECVSFLSRHSALNKKYVTRVCESIEELLQKRCRYYMWNDMNLSILYVLSWAKWAVWFSACFTHTYLERRMMCGSACTDKFHIQTTRSCFTGQLIRTLCFLLPLPSPLFPLSLSPPSPLFPSLPLLRVSMVFVYSHSSEHCQTILNSLESLGNLHITASWSQSCMRHHCCITWSSHLVTWPRPSQTFIQWVTQFTMCVCLFVTFF